MINKKVKEAIDRICSNFDYNTCCYEVKYDDWDIILNHIGKLQQLSDKIIAKITEFDYEYEKAKRKNDNDRADFYFDLMKHFKELLGE